MKLTEDRLPSGVVRILQDLTESPRDNEWASTLGALSLFLPALCLQNWVKADELWAITEAGRAALAEVAS